jgi:hypothetical protein
VRRTSSNDHDTEFSLAFAARRALIARAAGFVSFHRVGAAS